MSGGFFSIARSAASPSMATLSLYSPRSASTRTSTLASESSTTSTRDSDSSFKVASWFPYDAARTSRLMTS